MIKAEVLALIDATWPAERVETVAGYALRRTKGAGRRVAAASACGPFDPAALAALLDDHAPDTFAVFPEEGALDRALAAEGFEKVDALVYLEAEVAALRGTAGDDGARCYAHWPPLAATLDLWEAGGVGPTRLAVMARARGAKAALLARVENRAAGVAFVGVMGRAAMLHALYVPEAWRRQGVGRALVEAAALWAEGAGAARLGLVVLADNRPARALYHGLGFSERAQYHYRVRGDGALTSSRALCR